jgi:hypothetical protein
MNNVMIRYDVFVLRSVNNQIIFEEKTILINCSASHELVEMTNVLDRQKISKVKEKAACINSTYTGQLNFEITLKNRIKHLVDYSDYSEKEVCQLTLFDTLSKKFQVINDFSYDYNLVETLENMRYESGFMHDDKELSFIKGLVFDSKLIKEIINKIISEITFENLSSESGLFSLSDVGNKVLTDDLTIEVLPTETFDDEGYIQKKVTIVKKGILKKIFSLNENSILDDSYVGGYIEVDEYRKKKNVINDVFICTKEIEMIDYNLDEVYEVSAFELYGDNTLVFSISYKEKKRASYKAEVKKFLNKLVFLKNTNQFAFFEQS